MDDETKREIDQDVAKANREVVSGLEESKQDLKSDAAETKGDLKAGAAEAKDAVEEKYSETKRDVKAGAAEAKDAVEEKVSETKGDLKEKFSETRDAVAEKYSETKRDVAHMVSDGAITDEMSKLRSELAGVMESVSRMGKDKVHAITHSEPVTQSLAAGEAAIDGLTRELRALENDIAESTRRYPWRALGIAGVVGFLVGFLVRR